MTVTHAPPLDAIRAAFDLLAPTMNTPAAWVMLLAIGWQESSFAHRRQQPQGPARGFWQFERSGGVAGVLSHRSSRDRALAVCAARGVEPESAAVHGRLEQDDVLAAAFARLLLWTDPANVPPAEASAEDRAWNLYLRTWRPGKPHRDRWPDNHARALKTLPIIGA